MKKLATLIILIATALSAASAQTAGDIIEITDMAIVRNGEDVDISFRAEAGRRAVKSKYTATIQPVMSGVSGDVELPVIIVEGRRAAIARKRHGTEASYPSNAYIVRNGGTVDYKFSVPFDILNPGSELHLDATLAGCCSEQQAQRELLASNFIREGIIVIDPIYELMPPTTGENLADKYAFVAPLSEFEQQSGKDRDAYISDTRDFSLTIYYHQSRRIIDPVYRNNKKILDDLMDAINSLLAAGDSKISHVVIAGFASPEGTTTYNQKLAYDRAVVLKDYLVAQTGIDAELIDIYNGGVDWAGLRWLVEKSDMKEKSQVIDILDNVPVWDVKNNRGRRGELMKLNGGMTYRTMLREIFPELRNATYIRIYYEDIEK